MTEDTRLTDAVCRDIAGRQRYLGGPARIADALSQLMARRGYARIQAASELDAAWGDAVGEQLATQSRPGNLRRGVLEVTVGNSAVLQELTFVKRTILKELQRTVPEQKIRDLRFRVGPID
jgi:predicted nucleic acid-binding Zn ribbon protein